MATETVQHFVSVSPDAHLVTRARIVCGRGADDVALFIGDRIVGTVTLPRGQGARFCEQMELVDRATIVSFDDIVEEFRKAVGE